jgi:hypothetical protein
MSEYPVQDFDQLQGLDSNNSRLDPFLDEVNDFEYLDWLSKCGGASGPASGLTLLAPSISLPSSALSHHATPFELSPGTGIDSNEAQSVNFTDHGSLVYLASLPLRAWLTMSHGYDQHTAQSYWHVPDSYSQLNGTLHHSPIDERQRVPLPIGQQMEASMAIVNTSGLSDEDEENGLGAELGGSPTKITYPCLAQCGDSEW